MKTLFVAVATGQNVANLPPIVEMGQTGDRVLWIVSPEAKARGWAGGASDVLRRRGFEIWETMAEVSEINSPYALVHESSQVLELALRGVEQLMLVANGGQKLTPIGLNVIINRRGLPATRILYGQHKPAELWVVNPEDWSIERKSYSCHIRLDEILTCNGYRIKSPRWSANGTKQIWSSDPQEACPRIESNYPNSPSAVNELHLKHCARGRSAIYEPFKPDYGVLPNLFGCNAVEAWKRPALKLIANGGKSSLKPLYNATRVLLGMQAHAPTWDESHAEELRNKLQHFFAHVDRLRRNEDPERPVNMDEMLPELYSTVRNFVNREATKRINAHRPHRGIPRLGPMFEDAVAARIQSWLVNSSGEDGLITQAWMNVGVCKANGVSNGSSDTEAELDVVLVLVNGLLIHFEVKSFTAAKKDLDARILNLQRASSRLANMVLILPIYTHFTDEDWFREEWRLCQLLDSVTDIKIVPFTLLRQPNGFEDPVSGKWQEVKPFETNLDSILRPYAVELKKTR